MSILHLSSINLNKGIGALNKSVEEAEIPSLNWNLLREDIALPAAILSKEKILHNAAWMKKFIEAYGVKLAPHGKTTMTPKLFQLQMEHGAWGITLATAHQTMIAYEHGIRRVLMANQLIGKANMAIISRLLEDSSFTYYCLVDSSDQIDQLGEFFANKKQQLRVLLELGAAGGRTGVRNEDQLQHCLAALEKWSSTILLSGIEVYEGVLDSETSIREFLTRAAEITTVLQRQKRFQIAPVILTGAGSAWYDVVADVFSKASFDTPVEVILRPGCYLTHDVGVYRQAQADIQQRNPIAHEMKSGLLPALHIWAYVQSIPEPQRAIIAMGKRDAAFDAGLPVPALHYRPGDTAPKAAASHWITTKMMDQHAYLQIEEGDDLRVGDMIAFDISHPCLTFDKWRTLLLVDDQYQVKDILPTFF